MLLLTIAELCLHSTQTSLPAMTYREDNFFTTLYLFIPTEVLSDKCQGPLKNNNDIIDKHSLQSICYLKTSLSEVAEAVEKQNREAVLIFTFEVEMEQNG